MNTAGRGVILAIAAVVLGAVILGQGFDDPTTVVSSDGTTATPTPVPSSDGSDDGGATDGTDGSADDGSADGTDGTTDDGSTDGSADGSATDGTTDDGTTDEGSTAVLHPASQVRLMVANGTDYRGLAKLISDKLVSSEGFVGLTPQNSANGDAVALTTVYYIDGYQLDAARIAAAIETDRVLPMPDPPPVDGLQEANILIELGLDSQPDA
jgi:LytR cell envelope-related transcriptional attenuator